LLREHVHEQQHLRSRFGCPASAAQETCCAEILYRDYFWAPGTDSAGTESRGGSRTLKATLPSKYHDSVTILCSVAARATRSAPIRKPRCPATSFVQSRVQVWAGGVPTRDLSGSSSMIQPYTSSQFLDWHGSRPPFVLWEWIRRAQGAAHRAVRAPPPPMQARHACHPLPPAGGARGVRCFVTRRTEDRPADGAQDKLQSRPPPVRAPVQNTAASHRAYVLRG
jgi:hypothetical protein